MSITYYTIFIWCLMTSILEIVCTVQNPLVVNYKEMGKLLEKSVYINGSIIHLDEWLLRVFDKNGEFIVNDKNSKTMLTFVECKFAHLANSFMDSIYHLFVDGSNNAQKSKSSNAQNEYWQMVIMTDSRLMAVNKRIKKAITILFKISDVLPSVKSIESYFLYTLLTTSFSIDSLTSTKNGKKRTLPNHHWTDSSKPPQNLDRVLLEIMNVIRQYDIENCFPGLDNKNSNDKNVAIQRIDNFSKFLNTIVLKEQLPIDIDDIKLRKCLQDQENYRELKSTFCTDFLPDSRVKNALTVETPVKVWYKDIEFSYDVELVYKFMCIVYKVILKFVYQMTAELWTNGNPLGIEQCKRIIEQLRSIHCPIEIMDHFEFVLKVESYNNNSNTISSLLHDTAEKVITPKARMIDDVFLFNDYVETLSLSDLIDGVSDDTFKEFWWTFDLLNNESEKKSYRAYDNIVSLTSFAKSDISSSGEKTELKCNSDELSNVYRLCLTIESTIEDCLHPSKIGKSDFYKCLPKIRVPLIGLSNDLLRILHNWMETDQRNTADLKNIYTAAIINVTRELYNDIDTNTISKYKYQNTVLNELIRLKLVKRTKVLDGIMNLLDNFQIRNCQVIKDRSFIRENMFKMYGNVEAFISFLNNPTIPVNDSDFYDIGHMTGENILIISPSLGSKIFFNWQGEIQNMRDIQVYISKNMLNIRDLVNYQRLFFRWTLYAFYQMWFIIFKYQINHIKLYSDRAFIYSTAFGYVDKFHNIAFPEPHRKYVEYFKSKYEFYKIIYKEDENRVWSKIVDGVKEEIINSMAKILGIVEENEEKTIDISDIKIFLDIKEESDLRNIVFVYKKWLKAINEIFIRINRYFIYFEHDLLNM